MKIPMMKCGHSANAEDGHGNPACAICAPYPPAYQVWENPPDMSERMARCTYYGKPTRKSECDACDHNGTKEPHVCQCERPSSTELAFFEYKPECKFDNFYCGCHSWD
jgi:hypothetical protein